MPRYERGLWRDMPSEARGSLLELYTALRQQFGPFRRWGVAKRWAKLVAESWFAAEAASEEAVQTVVKRRQGRGRRPKASQMNQALKRQGLGLETLDGTMLRRLEALVGGKRDLATALREGRR